MRHTKNSLLVLAILLLLAVGNAAAQAPSIFYTDLVSGPNSGGEANNGTVVTLYGKRFGASRGSSTVTVGGGAVATYKSWSDTKVAVAIGSSAVSGTIVLTTSAGASVCGDTDPLGLNPQGGCGFTVRSGNIYCSASVAAAPAGSATPDDNVNDGLFGVAPHGCFASIWRGKIALESNPGGIAYSLGTLSATNNEGGYGALWIRTTGSAAAPNALVAYPGANITVGGPDPTGVQWAFATGNADGSHWVFAGMTVIGSGSGGQAFHPVSGNDWRVVGNLIECPSANGLIGCFEADLFGQVRLLGNEVTNVSTTLPSTSTKLQDAVYLSTDSNHDEVAWNYIHDNKSCRGIIAHSSPVNGSTGYNQYDIHIHHNKIANTPCDGISIATVDPSQGTVEVYDNLLWHVGAGPDPWDGYSGYAGIDALAECENGTEGSGTISIYNNTIYDAGGGGSGTGNHGAVQFNGNNLSSHCTGSPSNLSVVLTNNILYQLSGETYLESNGGNGLPDISGANNLWYGVGTGPPGGTGTFTGNVNANPLVVNPATPDFHLQSGSPAKNGGSTKIAANPDLDGVTRPQNTTYSLGVYELVGAAPGPSYCCGTF